MKQTIKNSCFSKMKRVVLVLFAALCAGSAMAGDRGVFWSRPPEINVSPDGLITVKSGTANNYTWSKDDSGHDKATYDAAVNGLTCEDRLEYTLVTTEGETITREIIVKEAYSVTNVGWHGPTVDKDYMHQIEEWGSYQVISVSVTYKAILNKSVSSTIDYNNKQNRDKFIYSGYDFEMSGVLSTSCTWDNSKNCFVVLGSAIADSVKIQYALGGMDLTTSSELVESKTVSASGNEYRIEIPYTDDRKLIWRVYAVEDGDESLYVDNSQKSVFEKIRWDNSRVTYTWQGGLEEGNWTDSFNWSTDVSEAWGYPGTKGERYYCTSVRFESDAEVDLENGTYTFRDGGASLYFAPGINVVLKNGTLGLHSSYIIGAVGTTVEYNNMKLIYTNEGPDTHTNLSFADGSTNIFSGTINCPLNYLPIKSNTKVVFKDGEIKTEYSNSTFSNLDSHEVEINNAKWTIKVNNCSDGAKHGIAGLVKFRDGVDRQARLVVDSKKALKLQGTYDFVLPATPYETAYVEAGAANAVEESFNVRVDASNISGEYKVPLIKFSAADDATKTAMQAVADNAAKLQVVVDGEVVDNASRNARLFWEGNILYFQQDSENAALVDGVEYATLGDAFAAVQAGGTVKLLRDNLEIAEMLSITKDFTIDLNGRTLKETVTPAEGEDRGAIYVGVGKTLTVTDSLSFGKITSNGDIVIGNYGTVIVNKGTIEAGADAENDVSIYNFYYSGSIYGKATVNGGSIGRIWNCGTLNITAGTVADVDNSGAMTIAAGATVTKILLKNGSDAAEVPGAGTITAPEGLEIESDVEGYKAAYENGVYTLVVDTVTVAPGGAAAVVDTEADADAVEIAVEVPASVDISLDAYKAYFTKSITQNSEGKYEVTAVLKDEVKPVISTTKPAITFEDGKVTVNVDNELPGLYYGVRYATTVEAVETTAPVAGLMVTPAEGDTAGFFRVVVDFEPIGETEAE